MPGFVVLNQISAHPVDIDGYSAAFRTGGALGSNSASLIIGGNDGGVARQVRVATDGTVRIDPTGTTTQPISAVALPLPAGAATEATLAARLPTTLVAGRLDTNLGSWLGSTVPTVGQKTAAQSIPVSIASDQPAISVSVGSAVTPHYYVLYDRIVPAQNKYMASLFNPSGSGKKMLIKRVYVMNWQASGNQSSTMDQYMTFISARTGGTAVTIRPFDSTNPATVMVAATGLATVTETYLIRRFFASANAVNLANANWYNALAFAINGEVFTVKNDVVPLVFRPGEGVALRNITNNAQGTVSYIIEYSEESL